MHTLKIALGVLLLLPISAAAQQATTSTDVRVQKNEERAIRTEAKAQFMASTTASEMRAKAELRANAAMRLSTSTKNNEERIANAKERAQAEITRRIAGLEKLLERIAAMKRLSESFKGELRATVDAEIANMEALAAKIEAGTSTSTLKADIQSITKSYRIFALVVPKAHIAAVAEKVVTMTAIMGEMGGKLKNRIDAAGGSGQDVSTLTAALAELSANIDSANAHAKVAVEGTANLKPDEGDETVLQANQAALKVAREELRLAHQDIQEGRQAIQTIIQGLKALAPKPSDTEDADTSTSTTEVTP